ncbi:MAG TPA: hypothetical protein VGL72_10740 [Bryobacteraceae bacterium]
MAGRTSQVNKSAAISKALEVAPFSDAIRTHVQQIAASSEFKNSGRSREFLVVIVEKALAGRFDELKERVLGVELFDRATAYDTAEDAIVRVTACDVRRRLGRYYSSSGKDSELRVAIPAGSYIPEFHWVEPTSARPDLPLPAPSMPEDPVAPAIRVSPPARPWWIYLAVGFILGMGAWGLGGRIFAGKKSPEVLPWSALLQKGRRLQIVVADTEISKMQTFGGYNLSLSDYANHIYRPAEISVPADVKGLIETFRGQSMGATDVAISLAISQRAFGTTQQVSLLPARGVQLKDFRTDDNFVLLGSPRSDPWVSLFQDRLDFQLVYDNAQTGEVVRNRRPRKGEEQVYTPSAKGWGTGQAFGVVSFIANPNQSGHALLLGGSSAEATDAASKFALNSEMVGALLKANGIQSIGNPVSFQVLLRVNTMAGSANTFEVIAFHRL